jgi:signal transduction histidine kinase
MLLEPIDLRLLVKDTLTSVQLQAEQKGLRLEVEMEETAPVVTDAARVRQILLNLLSNAVKFTSEGGVTVRLRTTADTFALDVADTGPGIAPEDLERVFEEFEQTHQSHARGGTGLGLTISRRLAHLLDGTLTLESTVGQGTTFTLSLPHRPPETPSSPPEP